MKLVKKNAKFLVVFLVLMLVSILPLCVFAESPRVVDDADILTSSEESELEAKLDALVEKLGHDIIVVTVNDLGGKDIQLYAHDYYDDNGYGLGDDDSGILLLVCTSPSEYAMSTCGRAEDIFTENDFTSLENAFWDHLHNNDYYEAFDAFADECEQVIIYDNRLTPIWIVISLIVGAVVGGIVIWSMRSKLKSVKAQRGSANYMLRDTFRLDRSRDVYLYSHVTRRVKPQNNGSSSSGSGRSSSGRSHGGRSGSF